MDLNENNNKKILLISMDFYKVKGSFVDEK